MNFSKKSGKKKAAAVAVLCFVAAIAITGTYTFNDYKKSLNEKELAKAEEMNKTEEKYTVETGKELLDEAVDGEIISNEVTNPSEEMDTSDAENNSAEENDSEEKNDSEGENNFKGDADSAEQTKQAATEQVENVSESDTVSINFTEDSLMLWPVSGTLLMDYSMDKTVYFKTLDQYKYNPAMIIAGAEGDQVIPGVSGIVKSIDQVAETGTTVNVDLGNGYEAFYGQLVSVQVKTGDYVDATTTLGYVAEPTKYYSSEGSNLYFEMRKDGRPVDPKMYLTDYVEE